MQSGLKRHLSFTLHRQKYRRVVLSAEDVTVMIYVDLRGYLLSFDSSDSSCFAEQIKTARVIARCGERRSRFFICCARRKRRGGARHGGLAGQEGRGPGPGRLVSTGGQVARKQTGAKQSIRVTAAYPSAGSLPYSFFSPSPTPPARRLNEYQTA